MMRRPSICYAAPGHTLLSSAGSTRNILAAAAALSEWADVTVAFRDIAEPMSSDRFEVIAIESAHQAHQASGARTDDVAARGLNPLAHLRHLRQLRRFARDHAGRFDLVLEKGWRLSGLLSWQFLRQGTPAVLIENDARFWDIPLTDMRTRARYLFHLAAQQVAGFCTRRIPVTIAETGQLKRALVEERSVPAERIQVVHLGVDHGLFRPMDQAEARLNLGLDPDALIMLYVGGMDQYHDLSPLLLALQQTAPDTSPLQLHFVGDGEFRSRYEELAGAASVPVFFHGQREHTQVPQFVAAADVCLAPYNTRGFHNGQVYFSTLKIPEYMACDRPVISVPSGHILELIQSEQTGFLFANEVDEWKSFLNDLPSKSRLRDMGHKAGPRVAAMSWQATARAYLQHAGMDVGSEERPGFDTEAAIG